MGYTDLLKKDTKNKRTTCINVRLSQDELDKIQEYADKYTEGNVSDFVRAFINKLMPELEKKRGTK